MKSCWILYWTVSLSLHPVHWWLKQMGPVPGFSFYTWSRAHRICDREHLGARWEFTETGILFRNCEYHVCPLSTITKTKFVILHECSFLAFVIYFLFGYFGLKVKVLVAQLCLTLCDPMGCSPPGSSVPGILQARILEWVAISFSRESSQPRGQTWVSCIAGRFFTNWAIREAPFWVR